MNAKTEYNGVLFQVTGPPGRIVVDPAILTVTLRRIKDSKYPLYSVNLINDASAQLAPGLYQLQVGEEAGPAFAAQYEGEVRLDAPWLAQESIWGWDTRRWEKWVEIMEQPLTDGDPIILSDNETIVTLGALRSVKLAYPQGPPSGHSEMTIPSRRRMVVLSRSGNVSEMSVEIGIPLARRGPERYETTRARGWSPIHDGSVVSWEWRGAGASGSIDTTIPHARESKNRIIDLETLSSASQRAWDRFGIDVWWRGQSCETYELIAPAHRAPNRNRKYFEQNSARHFIRGARARHQNCPGNDEFLEWLLLMQHHGLPTRLMDWSESPFTAAFFACLSHDDTDGVIWALAPYRFNQSMINDRQIINTGHEVASALLRAAFDPGAPNDLQGLAAALHTPHTHQRMMAQLSAFTIHGGPYALESLPERERFLLAFRIPAGAKLHLRKLLYVAGVRKSALFPDLDNLADDVRTFRPPYWLDRTEGRYGGAFIGTYALDPVQFESGEPLLDFVPNSGFRINEAAALALELPDLSTANGEHGLGAILFHWSNLGLEIRSVNQETPGAFHLHLKDMPVSSTDPEQTALLPNIPQGRYRLDQGDQSLIVVIDSRRDWQD